MLDMVCEISGALPQGTFLESVLFLIFTNDLLDQLLEELVCSLIWSDNCIVYMSMRKETASSSRTLIILGGVIDGE